jgi:hypothetical protein
MIAIIKKKGIRKRLTAQGSRRRAYGTRFGNKVLLAPYAVSREPFFYWDF